MKETMNVIKKIKGPIVLALSGGPDSMVLLNLLLKEKKQVICAHVNHNLRKESENEAKIVEEYCLNKNIPLEYMKIKKYKNNKFSEPEARKIRYDFFEKVLKKYDSSTLLTAHHGDDLIETVLMRIVRGSTHKGYAGFELICNKNNYNILRPLIFLTKEQILLYAKKNNISYVTDQTNFKDTYTRNRFRMYVLPKLKEEDPNVHDKFYKFSKNLLEYDNYIQKEKNKIIKSVYDRSINLIEFKKQDQIIQKEILKDLLKDNYDDLSILTDNHINEIKNIIFNKKPNLTINLPNNLLAIKSYDKLQIKENTITDEYSYKFNKDIKLPNSHKLKFEKTIKDNSNNTCLLSSSEIKLPLIVRTKQAGDKIKVKGLNGTKKVKDIFIDEKIPIEERKLYPIVTDSANKILWIPGLKKSQFSKQNQDICDIIIRYY